MPKNPAQGAEPHAKPALRRSPVCLAVATPPDTQHTHAPHLDDQPAPQRPFPSLRVA